MLTTTQAAAILKIAARTVKDYCADGRLQAVKYGRDWLIEETEVKRYQRERRPRGPQPKR
jgi:excisionase family DNA binding protein